MRTHILGPAAASLIVLFAGGLLPFPAHAASFQVSIAAEEDVYSYTPPDNGAGPLWCFGSTQIVRMGGAVYVSQMETGEDVPPLCNTRWRLLRREGHSWNTLDVPDDFRQREPCPLTVVDNALFLYVNDSLTEPGTHYQPCKPYLRRYRFVSGDNYEVTSIEPEWPGTPYFTDHSYRGFGADGKRGELLMLNIDARTSELHYAWLAGNGRTIRNGGIVYPIRACYPQAALNDGAAHVLAIGDIVEPVEEWRRYKAEQTGREWDYVFRILYYTYTPDLRAQDFREPIEIANVDATAGAIRNQDLWIGPDGSAYVLYTESEVASELMRAQFFPAKPARSVIPDLKLAVVRGGEVVSRRTLAAGSESAQPGTARFHASTGNTLYVVYSVSGSGGAETRLLRVNGAEQQPDEVAIPFETPFTAFTLASVRAGAPPSATIDILGYRQGIGNTLAYGQVQIQQAGSGVR